MPEMNAVQVRAPGAELELVRREIPRPGHGEVLLRVEACGVCHGDALAQEGKFPGLTYPRIPGREVVGSISQAGPGVEGWEIGTRVGIGWHGGHCFKCRACRRGDFWACEKSLTTGLNVDGGYAEYMVAREEVLTPIPAELASLEAAPILCAGRTTFGALKGSGARPGDLVAIHGLGGLGHLAVQYAVRMGLRTVVLSRGASKESLARQLGAHAFIDTTRQEAAAELKKLGGAQVILCTAPNSAAIAGLAPGLGRGGQLLVVTGAGEPMSISPSVLLGGGRSVRGWVGGGVEEALQFSTLFRVTPMVEVFQLEQAQKAFDKMMSAKVHFRAVLRVSR